MPGSCCPNLLLCCPQRLLFCTTGILLRRLEVMIPLSLIATSCSLIFVGVSFACIAAERCQPDGSQPHYRRRGECWRNVSLHNPVIHWRYRKALSGVNDETFSGLMRARLFDATCAESWHTSVCICGLRGC